MGNKLSSTGGRLPFANSAGDHELSSGRRLPFTDSIGESLDGKVASLDLAGEIPNCFSGGKTATCQLCRGIHTTWRRELLINPLGNAKIDYLIRIRLSSVALWENLG